MSAVVLNALNDALTKENQNRAELRKTADRLAAEAVSAQAAAVASEAACAELKKAVDDITTGAAS